MTLVGRTIVRITGFVGEPGFNIIHWTAGLGPGPSDTGGVEEFHDTLEASYSAIADAYNNQQTIEIEPQVVYFNDDDGVLLGSTTDPSGSRYIDCTSTSFFVDRAMCLTMRLRTDGYVNGRRLQGRIFLGPASAQYLGGDGLVTEAAAAGVAGAFAGCISGAGGRLAVWHRPTDAAPASGTYQDVTSLSVNRVPGTLRSRKT